MGAQKPASNPARPARPKKSNPSTNAELRVMATES